MLYPKIFSNKGLEKYRSQKTPSSFEECANVHSKCEATYVDKWIKIIEKGTERLWKKM